MSIEFINLGSSPNDGEGDPLRVAFAKVNNNFIYTQQTATNIIESITLNDDQGQVIFNYPADAFTQGQFQIKSYNQDNNDSQDVLISVQTLNDLSDVKFTAYGTTINGTVLTSYNMDIDNGNVRLMVNPLQNVVINHFITYQITWQGDLGTGITITSESGESLITELGNVTITTE